MQYPEAKHAFIHAWGTLGTSWGINKAMAQIHALLLLATEPLTTEEIMKELRISRGNANMNLRALMEWGIVKKEHRKGERKEYFSTGKDISDLARQIARERKRRELDPIIKVLEEVQSVSGENRKAVNEFKKVSADLLSYTQKAESLLSKFAATDQNWFFRLLTKA